MRHARNHPTNLHFGKQGCLEYICGMNKDLMAQIESRLQLAITMAMFFPPLVYTFLKFAEESEQAANINLLAISGIVALYTLTYVSFAYTKNKLTISELKLVDVILIVGVGSYILPITY